MPKPGPSSPIATVAAALELACGGPGAPIRDTDRLVGGNSGFPDRLGPDREMGISGKYFEWTSLIAPGDSDRTGLHRASVRLAATAALA